MSQNYKHTSLIALTILATALLMPVVQAQAPAKTPSAAQSGPGSMMQGGTGMDPKAMMKENNDKMSAMQTTGQR